MTSETHLIDCMELMAKYPDNYFDLAVVDPPYGIEIAKWDAKEHIPDEIYFNELFRISKNQIVWGANYFNLPHSESWICWDKTLSSGNTALGKDFKAEFELAWSSFTNIKSKIFRYTYDGNIQGFNGGKVDYSFKSIHPTQKPIALYDWVFSKYAKKHICDHKHGKEYKYLCTDCKNIPNFRVLDTHLGSQSSRIAAYKAGLDFVGSELDPDYFRDGNQRFEDFKIQFEQEIGVEKVLKGQARLF